MDTLPRHQNQQWQPHDTVAAMPIVAPPFEQPTSLAILRDRILTHNATLVELLESLARTRAGTMGESEPPFEAQELSLPPSCRLGEIEAALNEQARLICAVKVHADALQRL